MSEKQVIEVVVASDAQQVAAKSADLLIALAAQSAHAPNVALSGGSTPRAMYYHLAEQPSEVLGNLRRVNYFVGDERSVHNYHEDSNVRLAVENLFRPAGIPWRCLQAPDGGAKDLAAEAARYGNLMKQLLPTGANGQPQFDIVYLGMGGDGHTASLFPGTRALSEKQATFVANEVPQLGTWRLTLTYPALAAASHLVISLAGASKADVLAEIFTGAAQGKYPIEHLSAPRITWIIDEAAAASLNPEQIANYQKKGNA